MTVNSLFFLVECGVSIFPFSYWFFFSSDLLHYCLKPFKMHILTKNASNSSADQIIEYNGFQMYNRI